MTFNSSSPIGTLDGRVAVVTGAASGIGAATARRLCGLGARVALVARRADRLDDLAADLGDRAIAVPTDLTDPDAVDALAARVRDELGPADLLVNAAGLMLPNPLTEGRDEEWRRMLDINLAAILTTTKALLPDLLAAAQGGEPADIVNVSSTGADNAVPAFAVYGATKAALSYLSQALRAELASAGLRVSDIKPGGVSTELFDHGTHPAIREQLRTATQHMRLLDPDDVADTIAYAVTRPSHICLSQLIVLPTTQRA